VEHRSDNCAIRLSFKPEIRALAAGLGVWGRVRSESYPLRPRDRVEIYQPLKADPKEQRRRRAR
jgi:putative ubiquitin-RnfH superfamily antitoxin RatB of RatAB toxin-antitoxin module